LKNHILKEILLFRRIIVELEVKNIETCICRKSKRVDIMGITKLIKSVTVNISFMLKGFMRKHTYGLHKKMFIAIFSVGLVLIISLCIVTLRVASGYIQKDIKSKLLNQTQQISNIIDLYINNMKSTAVSISVNRNVIDLMNGGYSDYQSFVIYRDIYRLFNASLAVNRSNNIYIFSEHNKNLLSSNPLDITDNYSKYGVEGTDWYKNVMNSPLDTVLLDRFVSPVLASGDKFGQALRVKNGYMQGIQGIILICAEKAYFNEILKHTTYTTMDFIIIANQKGEIIYTSNEDQVQKDNIDSGKLIDVISNNKSTFRGEDNRRYLVNINKTEQTGWSVICFSNEKILLKSIYNMNTVIVIITSVCIGVLMILSVLISFQFTKPIKYLMKLMQRAEGKNYRIESQIERNDEIGDLSKCFNIMVKKVLENQVLLKEAQIDVLQQQINPHFLYNTLESIKTLAAMNGNDDIRSMTQMLGDMFRYSINREEDKIVSIRDEINHVVNYTGIQKIRYEDRMSVEYKIDEELYKYKTLKFVLQPIVENAIRHGIEQLSDHGLIKIKVYREKDDIFFEVIDNGQGIEDGLLKQLNDYISGKSNSMSMKKTQSIGLKNIQERIVLFLGEGYGLKVFSEIGKGTSVILKIPAWTEKEEYKNA
jgi:two-component system, sensor histidine kinase YesM